MPELRDELIELCDPWVTTIASDGYPSLATKKPESIADAILARFNLTEKEAEPDWGCGSCRACIDPELERQFALGKHPFVGMILCDNCGNKRCPHATNHALSCTGSNESGQEGSVYA